MKPFFILIGIIIFALTFSTPAFSRTIYKWTDENGVFHISDQPPPENIEHKKSKYKNSPVKKQRKAKQSNYKPFYDPNQQERRERAEREKQERAEKREQEAEKRQHKRELEKAKRRYEYLEGQEDIYKAHHRDATTAHYRKYWYKKMQEVSEARAKYFRLRDKYGKY